MQVLGKVAGGAHLCPGRSRQERVFSGGHAAFTQNTTPLRPLSTKKQRPNRPSAKHRKAEVRCAAASGGSAQLAARKVTLIHPTATEPSPDRPLLLYFPGSDGTGGAITPQLAKLTSAGFDVWCLYVPMADRSDWGQLVQQVLPLVRRLLERCEQQQLTLVAESWGACLALRCAVRAPHLLTRLVLVNPATCFQKSVGGVSSLIASTNLLSLFPEQLYQVAQAVLVPFLVDRTRVATPATRTIRDMMMMCPPTDYQIGEGIADEEYPVPGAQGAVTTFLPSSTANHRLNMLRDGNLPDADLRAITVPVLLLASVEDRLLPSLEETARLAGLLPTARRIVLPLSAHTALLESTVDLVALMATSGLFPGVAARLAAAARTAASSSAEAAASGRKAASAAAVKVQEGSEGARVVLNGNVNGFMSGALPVASRNGSSVLAAVGSAAAVASTNGSGVSTAGNGRANGYSNSAPFSSNGVRYGKSVSSSSNGNGAHKSALANGAGPDKDPSVEALSAWASNHIPDFIGSAEPAPASPAALASSVTLNNDTLNNGALSNGAGRTVAPPTAAAASSSAGDASRSRPAEQPSRVGRSSEEQWVWSVADDKYESAGRAMRVLRGLTAPLVSGTHNLPDPCARRPVLFVGNHTLFGLYDLPILVYELYIRGIKARGLAHPGHWSGPMGRFFEDFGAVKASPLAAYRLLQQGESVLLFPGGGREVVKRKGEAYKLFWREDRADFVRMAAKFNALIIPFAAVGADDAFDIFLDTDELLGAPLLGPLAQEALRRVDPHLDPRESVFPITTIPGTPLPSPFPVPNLNRLYFRFLEPIETRSSLCKDPAAAQEVYSRVKQAVEDGMALLQAERTTDPEASLGARLRKQVTNMLPAFDLMSQVLDREAAEIQ